MQVSTLQKSTRKIQVSVSEGELSVEYRPAAYTAEVEMMMLEAEKSPLSTMCKLIEKIVVSWDLMDGDQPYPVTFEALSRLPVQFLSAIVQAITEDMRPNPTSSAS